MLSTNTADIMRAETETGTRNQTPIQFHQIDNVNSTSTDTLAASTRQSGQIYTFDWQVLHHVHCFLSQRNNIIK